MIIKYKNYVNNTNHPVNKNKQPKKYSYKQLDDKVEFIQKYYTKVKSWTSGIHATIRITIWWWDC